MSEDDYTAAPDNAASAQAPLRADNSSRTVSSGLKIELPSVFKGEGTEFFTNWSRFEIGLVLGQSATHNPHYVDVTKQLMDVFGPNTHCHFFKHYVNAHPVGVFGSVLCITRLVLDAFPHYDSNAIEGEKFC